MITLLRNIFIENWLRKLISLFLAIIIWFVVDQSLTTSKNLNSVAIRIAHLPPGKTINGLQESGLLSKRVNINITGKKAFIEDLNPNDLEVVVDVSQIDSEGVVILEKKHLASLNPSLSIDRHVSRVAPKSLHINLVPLSEEKIPIYITKPIGEAPKGYQYLDIWPYHLNLTVSGPAETIAKLKQQGLKLTYNLNDISKQDLERDSVDKNKSVLSFFIPNSWKTLNLPSISDQPVEINDPDASLLRIDFIRSRSLAIDVPIPISLVFPAKHDMTSSPLSLNIGSSPLVNTYRGIKVLNKNLYTKGVSELFFDIVKDYLYIAITPSGKAEGASSTWTVLCSQPRTLEDTYVMRMITEYKDPELKALSPRHMEEHLRNRFRNYLNRLQLFDEEDKPFDFDISISGREVILSEKTRPQPPESES